MKKLLTVVVILLVVVAGVIIGVMQPWKKDGDSQKSEGKFTPQELASAKGTNDNGDSKEIKASKNTPAKAKKKPATQTIPTRVPLRTVATRKPEEHVDKNSTASAHSNPKPKILVGKHDPPSDPEEALRGNWMTSHDGFEFTIILKKGGTGEMRIAEGDRKATPHMITWKVDAKKLTLINKDPKTHHEDVTEGVYKLSNGNGIKSLQLEYELEKQDFTFISVKD